MRLIVAIYVAWIIATVAAFLLGASADVMGSMLGAPVGWSIGMVLIVGFHLARRRKA